MAKTHDTEAASHTTGTSGQGRAARTQLPQDRFDHVGTTHRVGAHRIVGAPKRFWLYLVSALLGVALLTGIGIAVVQIGGASIGTSTSETAAKRQAEKKVTPELDPEAAVVVLNGTSMPGFGGIVDGIITENDWGNILFSGDAASSDVQISAVFYTSVTDEPAALALANELGGVSIFQSYDYTEYGAQLVVLLGSDYAGPGSDQFVPGDPDAEGAASDESAE